MSESGSYLFHHFLWGVGNITHLIFYCDLPLDGTMHRGRAGKLTQERLRFGQRQTQNPRETLSLGFPRNPKELACGVNVSLINNQCEVGSQ